MKMADEAIYIGPAPSNESYLVIENIVRAIHVSHAAGIPVVGFTGQSGGAMVELCDVCFRMPSGETPKIQEGHELLGHMICGLIEHEMFADARG